MEVAEVMAAVDAGAYVLDFVPNVTVEQMEERMEQFYRIIRNKHPYTPIILWKILSLLVRIMTKEGLKFYRN